MKSFGTTQDSLKKAGMTHLNTDLISSVLFPDYESQQHHQASSRARQPSNPAGPAPPISSRLELKQNFQSSSREQQRHHLQSTTSSTGAAAQEVLIKSRRGSQVASTKGQQYIVSARKDLKRATSSGGRSRMQSGSGSYKTSRNSSFGHGVSRTMGSLSRDRSQLGCGLRSQDNHTLIYPCELKPQIMLFKLFAARTNLYTKQSQVTQLALNLPDTLVFNDASGIPNFWIQKLKGHVGIPFRRSEHNREAIIKSFLGQPFDPERDRYSSLDVIAVLKTLDETQTSCKTNLITRSEFEKVYDEIAKQKEKPACIQRYIKHKGSIATKVRVIYNKNRSVQFSNYIITNHVAMFEPLLTRFDQESVNRVREQLNQAYLIDIDSPDISIVKSVPGTNKQADQTQILVQTLLAYLETTCNLHFNSLVVDFIKDYEIFQSTETWHLTGIISYHLDPSAMSHVQLCLFPFTLNPHDDLRHYQPTLPMKSCKSDAAPSSQALLRPSSSRSSIHPSTHPTQKFLTDKQCGLCDLLYTKDRVGNMVPKGLIDTVREWVNQRLNKEVFQIASAPKGEQAAKKGQENANPNGVAHVGVCKDCAILFKRAIKSMQVVKLMQSKLHVTKTPLVGDTACRIFIYFSEIEDQRLAQCEKIIRNIEYQILSEPSVCIEVGKAQEIPYNKSMCNFRPIKVLKAHSFTALGEAEGRQKASEIVKALRLSITNPYRMRVVEMEFEEGVLAKGDCEPFSLQSSQILLRGVIAIDFHNATQSDTLIFQPLPDALMEHLDLIKKPSIVQPSSFVDLLDNISANNSFTALPQNDNKQKETKLALQDLKSEIDFSIVRDGRAQSIFEHAKDVPNYQQQLQPNQQRKIRPQSGKPAQIRNRPISGISQNHPQIGQRSSINPSVLSQVAFGTGYKESKHQRPHSGGILRSFGSQQKTILNSNTTAAGTNSCLNIDVNTFNHPHIYSSRKSNELQFAKKNYVLIKKTATHQSNSRPRSAQRKITQRFQPVVQEEVPSFDIPYLDDGVMKSSVNSQKVLNFKSQSRKAQRAKKLSKQEDDFLNMMLKKKIFSQKLNAGIHSGRVGQTKTRSPGQYVSTATSQSERPFFHMQPKAVLPKPLLNNLGIQ